MNKQEAIKLFKDRLNVVGDLNISEVTKFNEYYILHDFYCRIQFVISYWTKSAFLKICHVGGAEQSFDISDREFEKFNNLLEKRKQKEIIIELSNTSEND